MLSSDWGSLVLLFPRMVFSAHLRSFLLAASSIAGAAAASLSVAERAGDPCAVIGGQTWVAPKDLRACFTSIKVDPVIKDNIIQVINKTLAFHTSVNYEFRAPEPFTADVHEDLLGDLARISKQSYPSDYDLHIDFSRTLKRLNDGHCVWINACYDSLFLNFVPLPLALLTEKDGSQNVHIAPEAFQVASAEFGDEISFWQNTLPGALKGQLQSLSGARVLLINNQDPFVAVNANAMIAGSFQALGTRQNGFFSSYNRASGGWNYIMGNFAQQALPLSDSVTLTIIRSGHIAPETITVPYRARVGAATVPFTDTASWRANNCVAIDGTNGVDLSATSSPPPNTVNPNIPLVKFKQAPPVPPAVAKKQPMNVMLDTSPPSDVVLPPTLVPGLPTLNGSRTVQQFYMLKDGKTGVMALGSFSDDDFNAFLLGMLTGLQSLKSLGATQLIVDVSNNGGGFICAAHWLHRIIAGPKSTTVPQAGLDTKCRAGPLAQLIVDQIANHNADPNERLLFNPTNLANANDVFFSPTTDWLQPPVRTIINGRVDEFSQRLGEECSPDAFPTTPPATALFDTKKVMCELVFTIQCYDEQGRRTTHLKTNSLAPPDLVVNGVQGITWRLGFGVKDTTQPEEWQSRPVDLNLPITADIVNNPVAIWEAVAKKLLS
ncbi:hypothetical protein D9619_011355 [Psilocybe cf. subviscida]|uniref:Tail specific protease domain-containing protein n=1 Tax=Psilocybe cf. subviscida TaxID=2480587 RepID=A0A8H5BJF8_9AGAR|nr:hypothetical protein D9619_011355 [Psilocybe cf. subviscida]